MREPVPARMLWLVAGFVVWSSAFIVLYSLQALGCAYGWPDLPHRIVLFAVLGLHLAALALLFRRGRERVEGRFLRSVVVLTLWAALAATLLTYTPALALSACR